ncbi:MAG TPA: lipopolysaccharide biosynthesis protein [Thermoanaerobaculia bacterium]|nr:lipopolysaccharide biosynthesis protein [Thermoanaerobaculia bacterium]
MSIGGATIRAAAWAFVSTAGAKVITLVGLALLARLLAPGEFGLLAFALAYITYADTIGDLGAGPALVYWPDRRDDAAQVTFLVSIASGLFWCLSTIALAPFIADFFNAPEGTRIVQALSLGFVLKYLGNTHDALAQKDLRFRAHVIPDLSMATVNAGLALAMASAGWGAWSLVWGRLAGSACRTILMWLAVPWRPTLRVPRDLFGPMLRYGRSILMVNIAAAILLNADLVAVGRFLGTTTLGLYQMAARIPEATVMVLLIVLARVLFPALAKIHAEGRGLREPYLLVTRSISAVTIPASLGLAALAEPIVLLFFGAQWTASAPILRMLAIAAALQCLSWQAGDVLKATGNAALLARIAWIRVAMLIPAVVAGAQWSAVGAATGLVIATAIATVLSLAVSSPIIGVRLRDMAGALFPSVASGVVMALVVVAWTRWSGDLSPVVQVVFGVVIGAAVHVAVLALFDRALFRQALVLLFRPPERVQ